MKLRLFLTILMSLTLSIIFAACRSKDYYKDRAVQRARVFLLQEDRTLNLEQREYVKFNKPVIMATSIFEKIGSDSATSGTLSHVCIAWIAPGRKDAHVVFGVSDNRLRDWTPNRVIIKRYDRPARVYHAAKSRAVSFAVNNFLYLSNRQLNRIRFEVPETIVTNYKFSKGTLKGRKISEEKLKSLVQITFVWPSDTYEKRLFVCGLGAKNLGGWLPVFGGETTANELRDHFLSELSFGQFAPVPDNDKKASKAKKNKSKELPAIKEPGQKKPDPKKEIKVEKTKVKEPEIKKEIKVKEPKLEKPVVKKATKAEAPKAEKPAAKEKTKIKEPKAENPEVTEVKK